MSDLPPRARLVQIITSMVRRMSEEHGALLRHPHFDAERPALERLASVERARAAAQQMAEPEAVWLAESLLARWAALGQVELEPWVAITAPEVLWVGKRRTTHTLAVAVDGLEPGPRVRWECDRAPSGTVQAPELALEFDASDVRDVELRVSVDGKARGQRVLLVDSVTIRLATPLLAFREDHLQLLVRDQRERPAVDVAVSIGGEPYRTDRAGAIAVERPFPPGAEVLVEGIGAGAVPGAGSKR